MDTFAFIKLLEVIASSIWAVRCLPLDCHHEDWLRAHASVHSQIALGYELNIITWDQSQRLRALLSNAALQYCGLPFPSSLNAGPTIPWYELHKRNSAVLQLRGF